MIAYLEGTILSREEDRIVLLVNHVGYEILLPAHIMEGLQENLGGGARSFHIYYYQTERQPKPVLIGFNLEAEKEFFQYFITVEAIGPMKAVKAMTLPVRDIARAIENKDVATLQKLNGIGNRTAQKIIATLEGKMGKFALINPGEKLTDQGPVFDYTDMVLNVLVNQLGYKAPDAKRMVTEAIERNPAITTPEELFDEVYRGEKNN